VKFRVARHTTNLLVIINFYTNNVGLEILGEFRDHNGYDGVFIGKKGNEWHLEFTVSHDMPNHRADEDDLLVFYATSVEEYNAIKQRFADNNIREEIAKNPYWNENGITFTDPDGFRVTIAIG
jgi:hypothetical protein